MQSSEPVALKELWLWHGQDWKTLDLFQREARVLAGLDHPAIPKYVAHFQVEGDQGTAFYLAQSLAPGRSLSAWIRAGWRPAEPEVRAVADQILGLLEYLHGLSPPVVHRDIKPDNVLRDDAGRLYLVDFGAVRDTYRSTAQGSTVVGTFGYMAPEQFHGQALPATDLFGLGATCVHLLTHLAPEQLPRKKERPDFRGRTNVSPGFAEWLDRTLSPEPAKRFPSARAARVELARSARVTPRAVRLGLVVVLATGIVVPAAVVGALLVPWKGRSKAGAQSPEQRLEIHAAPESENGRLQFDRQLTGHQGIVSVVEYVEGGRFLASAASDGAVKLWDPLNGATVRAFTGHQGRIYAGDATNDGATLYTGTKTELRGWRVATGEQVLSVAAPPSGLAGVEVSPDGTSIAMGTWSGGFSLVDTRGQLKRSVERPGRTQAFAFSPDGKLLAAAGTHPEIGLYDVESGAKVAALAGHTATVGALRFSPDGKLLASSSDDRTAKLWSFAVTPPKLARTIEGFSSEVWSLAFSPDGGKLAIGARGGQLRVVDPFTGDSKDALKSTRVDYADAAFSRDGSTLALATAQGGVELWRWREPSWRPPAVTAPILATVPKPPPDLPKEAQLALTAKYLLRTGERRADVLEARRLLEQALAANPGFAPAHAGLAKVEQDLGYKSGFSFEPDALARAHVRVDRALELDPKLVEGHVRRGYLHLYAKDFGKAHQSADLARAVRANDPEIQLLEMDIAHLEEHQDQALTHARSVIEGSDDPALRYRAYRRLAGIYEAREEWDSAEICHVAVTRLDPTSAWAHGNFAAYLAGRKQYDRAIEEANRAIAIRDYPAAHTSLAIAYGGKAIELVDRKGDLDEAERWLDKARRESPGLAQEHLGRGKLALARGDRGLAKKELGEAVRLLPGNRVVKQLYDEVAGP